MKAFVRHGKTAALAALVIVSVILSFYLWSGNLQETSEIGFVQAPSMPTVSTPDLKHAIQPFEINVHTPAGNSVIQPGTSADAFWTSTFLKAHPYDAETITALPKDVKMRVSMNFGVELNRSLAQHWLANFSQVLGNWQGRQIVIYVLPKQTVCRIAFVGDNEILTVKTNFPIQKLVNTAQEDVAANPYTMWTDYNSVSFVPVKGRMSRLTYTVRQVDTEPIVHTFFVNPQAITRIQEDANTYLWTDGSRAVQWNKLTSRLQYEDPNAGTIAFRNDPFLTALDFIHTHGGGPADSIGFDQLSTLTDNSNSPTFSFTQYVSGYPILSNQTDDNVDIQSGRVVEYDRPMWALQSQVKATPVHLINQKRLLASLKSVDPTDTTAELHVELGYFPQTAQLSSGQVTLEPAYYVTTSAGSAWMIDAVDGSLLAGGGAL